MDANTTALIQLLGPAAGEVGLGGLAGYALGYVFKKVVKLLIYVVGALAGLELVVAYYFQSIGAITITVNYEKITGLASQATIWISTQLATFATGLSLISASFTAGLILGFGRG